MTKLHAPDSVLPGTSCSDCYARPLDGAGTRPRRKTMRRLHAFIVLVSALIIPLTGLVDAAPAMAYNLSAVYRDCEVNGQLTGHYSRGELQAAISHMPANMAEYSDCQSVIQRALLSASGPTGHHDKLNSPPAASGGSSGGGSGTSSGGGGAGKTGSTSAHSASAVAGTPEKGSSVTLGGSNIRPGSTGSTAAATSLPPLLLVVLVLLALTALSGGAVAIRRRVVARHST